MFHGVQVICLAKTQMFDSTHNPTWNCSSSLAHKKYYLCTFQLPPFFLYSIFYFFVWLFLVIIFLFMWWWWGCWSDTNTALGLTCLRVALAEEPGQHDPVQHALPPLQVVLDRVREEDGVDEAAGDHLDRPQCDQDPRESHRLERTLVGV